MVLSAPRHWNTTLSVWWTWLSTDNLGRALCDESWVVITKRQLHSTTRGATVISVQTLYLSQRLRFLAWKPTVVPTECALITNPTVTGPAKEIGPPSIDTAPANRRRVDANPLVYYRTPCIFKHARVHYCVGCTPYKSDRSHGTCRNGSAI